LVRKVLIVLAAVVLAGCKVAVNTPAAGTWKSTVIQVQKYRNALFREKATGKQLEPDAAQTLPPEQVTLEGGDFDELTYQNGRLRYAFFARESEVQPYMVEREWQEADFDALDKPFYDDHFFGLPAMNWDAKSRLPLYIVHYAQNQKDFESSFTPSLGKLPKLAPLVDGYIGQMSGDVKLPAGTKQLQYACSASAGVLTVSLTEASIDAVGDTIETPIKLTSVKYDAGQGQQSATLVPGGKSNIFTLPQPASAVVPFVRIALSVTPAAPRAAWDTLLPVRSSH
jgi:hypothetical protein